MRNFIIGVICGLAIGFFVYLFLIGKKPVHTEYSFFGPTGFLDYTTGQNYRTNYGNMSNKPFGTSTEFIIDSSGFKELVSNPKFSGFIITLGLKDPTDPHSLTLLFSGLDLITNPSRPDRYYCQKANGNNYLDKISGCPGSPNCP
jgi:hypothetical protein